MKRARFRLAAFSTYLAGVPWSPSFMEQYGKALDRVKSAATQAGSSRTVPGSVNALCVAYYASPDFRDLKPSTQVSRRYIIERFRAEHGTKPIKGLTRAHVSAIIGAKAAVPSSANNLLKALKVMLNYAVTIGMIDVNPCVGVRKFRIKGTGFPTWAEEDIVKFQERHPPGTRAYLALALLVHTAQRRSDVIRMGWQHIRLGNDGKFEISVTQQKTGTPLAIPLHPTLKAALDATPKTNMTFLVTEHGAPITHAGFGNWFREKCKQAGLPHLSAHGLRKAAAVRLAEAGCTPSMIASITGHKSLAEVALYTRGTDQRRLARQALDAQLRAEGEQKLSNPRTQVDKNAK